MAPEVAVARYLLPRAAASFKNAFRAQKGTTVNGARGATGTEEFVPICLKALCSLSMGRAAGVCSAGTTGQHFSRARITICSVRSRQSLKLFDARGLSMHRRGNARAGSRTPRPSDVLIMNIVFYDRAFSFSPVTFSLCSSNAAPITRIFRCCAASNSDGPGVNFSRFRSGFSAGEFLPVGVVTSRAIFTAEIDWNIKSIGAALFIGCTKQRSIIREKLSAAKFRPVSQDAPSRTDEDVTVYPGKERARGVVYSVVEPWQEHAREEQKRGEKRERGEKKELASRASYETACG